jgi:hypothetical protein
MFLLACRGQFLDAEKVTSLTGDDATRVCSDAALSEALPYVGEVMGLTIGDARGRGEGDPGWFIVWLALRRATWRWLWSYTSAMGMAQAVGDPRVGSASALAATRSRFGSLTRGLWWLGSGGRCEDAFGCH